MQPTQNPKVFTSSPFVGDSKSFIEGTSEGKEQGIPSSKKKIYKLQLI